MYITYIIYMFIYMYPFKKENDRFYELTDQII